MKPAGRYGQEKKKNEQRKAGQKKKKKWRSAITMSLCPLSLLIPPLKEQGKANGSNASRGQ